MIRTRCVRSRSMKARPMDTGITFFCGTIIINMLQFTPGWSADLANEIPYKP